MENLLSQELNAAQLAERMDIGVSAIRNHLETLEQKKYVKHFFKRVAKGRPKKMYAITERGSELFPRMRKELIQKMMERSRERFGENNFQEVLSGIAEELGRELESRLDGDSEEAFQIKEVLDDWGFYPEFTEEGKAYFIEYRNCLFPEISENFSGCFCGKIVSTASSEDTKVKEIKCQGNQEDEKCLHKIIPNSKK